MATQLDQATRDAVMAEANARAQRFGISPEQALYNYARENNISNSDVDTYMGYAPGSADAWVRQRDAGMAAQTTTPPAQQPAPQGNVAGSAQSKGPYPLVSFGPGGGYDPWAKPAPPAQQPAPQGNSYTAPSTPAAQPQPPRGIVESAMSQTLPTAGPTHWSVSPEMTVQGQLRTVMDSNSPLMQQARTQGLQVANERGLLNSSIAESAAMDSMYKAALPIAAADATTYAKSASENAGNATNITNSNTSAATSIANTAANNDTSRFNNAANNDTSRFNNAANNATTLAVNNSNNETSRANTAANNATTLATNAANNETSRANAKLQTDAAAALGLEESKYRKLVQGSSSAAQLMTNYQGQLSSLLKDQSFSDTEARQTAIDQLTNSTKAAIQMIGAMAGDLDIAAYMSQLFPAEEGKLAPASPVKW